MIRLRQSGQFPFPLRVFGSEEDALRVFRPCRTREIEVELPIVIGERRSPHTLCIVMLTVQQVIGIVVQHLLQGIRAILPIHQVLRLQDSGTREVIHRGTHHVIDAIHKHDINVREVAIDDRIHIRSIALVSTPHILILTGLCPQRTTKRKTIN